MGTELDKQIGARLRELRSCAGYTQAELAEKVGCETSTIGHCEVGKDRISLTLLSKIADVLEVELYKFLIAREPDTDRKTINDINKLLKSANRTQLGLIYEILSKMLDVTSLD